MDLKKILGMVGGFAGDRAQEPSTMLGGGMGMMAYNLMGSHPYAMYAVMAMSILAMLMKEKGSESKE